MLLKTTESFNTQASGPVSLYFVQQERLPSVTGHVQSTYCTAVFMSCSNYLAVTVAWTKECDVLFTWIMDHAVLSLLL